MTEDEMKQALEKFDDSKEIAEQSMFNLLECDVSCHGFLCRVSFCSVLINCIDIAGVLSPLTISIVAAPIISISAPALRA